MAVQIGAKSHSFSDPTGLLSDCHRRVEMFMRSLCQVADAADQPLTDETRRALDLSLRYFRESAPKHTADEEESLFPRLRRISDPELQAALARLDKLEADHRWAEPLHASVDALGLKYLEARHLSAEDAQQFRNAVRQLQEMYARHIEVEDRDVFPVAKKVLNPQMQQEIGYEMEARRGLISSRPVQLK